MTRPSTETVWRRLSADLRRFLRRRVGDDHLADDLLQEVFVRIHRKIDSLRESDRLAAWVYRIARNVVRDHYRQRQKASTALAEVSGAYHDVPDKSDEQSYLRSMAGLWLGELAEQLPMPYREAVRLSEIDGLRQREVAQRLDLTLPAAKSRIQRGRAMLKELLDQCCTFEFDRRGNLLDCDPKPDRKVCRGCGHAGGLPGSAATDH